MKKTLAYLALASMLLCCCGKAEPEPARPSVDGECRLLVDGKPFLMLGAQLRTDYFVQLDGREVEELDDYFSLAAGLNITCVQVPVSWRDIEPSRDEYSDRYVKAYIDYCEKYGMKLEILWFGSYMCGYSVEGYIPDYIISDSSTYPELNPSSSFNGWLGKHYYLKPGNTALVAREAKAISKMMEFVDSHDRSLGRPHTVIGVQIENEPDMLATRHNSSHGYSPTDIWPALLSHLNEIGKAVKSSPYDCYTRVNQTITYDDWIWWSGKVSAREGIDYVGFDPYIDDVGKLAGYLAAISEIPGNFAHVAENGGEFLNNDLLTLKALTMGCGYEVFEVITTPHPYLADWTLRGVYNPDFTPKAQTQRLIDAYGIFKSAWYDFATLTPDSMKGFNLETSSGKSVASETFPGKFGTIRWSTDDRGCAFALDGGWYVTAGSTKADVLLLDFSPESVETGFYGSDGKWTKESDASVIDGRLDMSPCKVYRITLKH